MFWSSPTTRAAPTKTTQRRHRGSTVQRIQQGFSIIIIKLRGILIACVIWRFKGERVYDDAAALSYQPKLEL